MSLKKMNLEARQSHWDKIAISPYGNNRFDILHPSLTSRIEKIEKALERKGFLINDTQENPKIEKLKVFMIGVKGKVEKAIENAGGTTGLLKEMYKI